MAKVQVLAVLSLDGCLSEKAGDACWALRPESYGIDKLFDAADYELTPAYPTSRLAENKSKSIFLIEANYETADYINGLLRLQLIDEIILYTVHCRNGATSVQVKLTDLSLEHGREERI